MLVLAGRNVRGPHRIVRLSCLAAMTVLVFALTEGTARSQTQPPLPPPQGRAPDLTTEGEIRFTNKMWVAGGVSVPWGGTATLKATQAKWCSKDNRCAFAIRYSITNRGATAVKNTRIRCPITVGGALVNNWEVGIVDLPPGKSLEVWTELNVPAGSSTLQLEIDADRVVPDADRGNNVRTLKIAMPSGKGSGAQCDLMIPDGGITIAKTLVPFGTTKTIPATMITPGPDGSCLIDVSYRVKNAGKGACGQFETTLMAGPDAIWANHVSASSRILAAGAVMTRTAPLKVWGGPPSGEVSLGIDAGDVVSETNESNNGGQITINIEHDCGASSRRR